MGKSPSIGSVIATASDAAEAFREAVKMAGKEEGFFVLPLDASGKMLAAPEMVALGYTDGTTGFNAGAVFRAALTKGAQALIVAHNHPSGDLKPSKADIAATAELRDLAKRMDVDFIDHIILGAGDAFLSLSELADD